jgi:hypothetical protein
LTEFTVHIDAAPGSGVDLDVLGRAHEAATAHPYLLGAAVSAHGDEHDATLGATFQVEAETAELAAGAAATWFGSVLAVAGVPQQLRRIDHLEVVRDVEPAAA